MFHDTLTSLSTVRVLGRVRLNMDGFLLSREAMRCSPRTLQAYEYALGHLYEFLNERQVDDPRFVTPTDLRAFLVHLQRQGLRDTTIHLHARCVKTWLRWLVAERVIERSPMEQVAMPRVDERVQEPYSPEDVKAMLAACDRSVPLGARDYAVVLALLDSGLRAAEFVSLKIGQIDMKSGLLSLRGKGGKQRQARVGARARQAILGYLRFFPELERGYALWEGCTGHGRGVARPLTQAGLRCLLIRLGKRAGVSPCSAHRFRRTFALWMLRDGCDLHSLRMLMGHADLTVCQRYLALAGEDIERAHMQHSPADKML